MKIKFINKDYLCFLPYNYAEIFLFYRILLTPFLKNDQRKDPLDFRSNKIRF